MMETELRSHLLDTVAAFAGLTGFEQSTIAQRAAGDWRFFERIRDGGSFNIKTYDKVMLWFHQNWPEAKRWPKGVPRPKPAEVS